MTTVQRIGNEHGHAIEAIAGANALDQPRELHREKGQWAAWPQRAQEHGALGTSVRMKISLSVVVRAGETFVLADIDGPGAIQQIWMTPPETGDSASCIYWDVQEQLTVEARRRLLRHGLGEYAQLSSLAQANPGRPTSYWETAPQALLDHDDQHRRRRYGPLLSDQLHAHGRPRTAPTPRALRRVNPLPYKSVYTILEGVQGQGHYGWHLSGLGRQQHGVVG